MGGLNSGRKRFPIAFCKVCRKECSKTERFNKILLCTLCSDWIERNGHSKKSLGCRIRLRRKFFFEKRRRKFLGNYYQRRTPHMPSSFDHLQVLIEAKNRLRKEVETNRKQKRFCLACQKEHIDGFLFFCMVCYVWLNNKGHDTKSLGCQVRLRKAHLRCSKKRGPSFTGRTSVKCLGCEKIIAYKGFCMSCRNWLQYNNYSSKSTVEKIEIRREFLNKKDRKSKLIEFKINPAVLDIKKRRCSKCGQEKPLGDFYSYKSGLPMSKCVECAIRYQKELKNEGKDRKAQGYECECGCGEQANEGRRFLQGHHLIGIRRSEGSLIREARTRRLMNPNLNLNPDPNKVIYLKFTKELREFIKERDNYDCQNPYCWKSSVSLAIHHVDYDKRNYDSENLITLCRPCNGRANANRDYWKELYLSITKRKSRLAA